MHTAPTLVVQSVRFQTWLLCLVTCCFLKSRYPHVLMCCCNDIPSSHLLWLLVVEHGLFYSSLFLISFVLFWWLLRPRVYPGPTTASSIFNFFFIFMDSISGLPNVFWHPYVAHSAFLAVTQPSWLSLSLPGCGGVAKSCTHVMAVVLIVNNGGRDPSESN